MRIVVRGKGCNGVKDVWQAEQIDGEGMKKRIYVLLSLSVEGNWDGFVDTRASTTSTFGNTVCDTYPPCHQNKKRNSLLSETASVRCSKAVQQLQDICTTSAGPISIGHSEMSTASLKGKARGGICLSARCFN